MKTYDRLNLFVIISVLVFLFPGYGYSIYEGYGQQTAKKQQKGKIIKDDQGNILGIQKNKTPDFLANEFIVKYKQNASQTFKRKLNAALNISPTDVGINSIKALNQKHKVISMEPVFEGLHRRLQKGASLQSLQNRNNARFPQRAARAPKGAQAPDLTGIYKITVPDGVDINQIVAEYRNDSNVEYAEPNYISKVYFTPNDPLYPQQWSHQKTEANIGWDVERGSSGIVIAIVDTGVDYSHEDLSSNIWRDIANNPGKDFVDINVSEYLQNNYQLVAGEDYELIDDDPSDYYGHGTHCAGIADAAGNNGIGVAGVCHNCKLMPVRACFSITHPTQGEVGLLEDDDIANAITYAADNGADVINMSFGGSRSLTINDAIDYAYSQGVVLIAAAGNSSTDQESYPAAYDNVIAVSATGALDTAAFYSNYGFWVDVAAPGGDSTNETILSTLPKTGTLGDPTGYGYLQGTSMAAPYVAGIAGLLLSKNPDLNVEQVRQLLIQGVDVLNSDKYIGTGRVNVNAALGIDYVPTADVKIAYPTTGDLVVADFISITGTATGESFVVEYGEGLYPDQWFVIGTGTLVVNGILAEWDTSAINYGNFVLRLTVSEGTGTVEDRTFFEIYKYSHEILEGWPNTMSTLQKGYSSPVIGDMDNDGNLEVLIGGSSGIVGIFEPTMFAWNHDGTNVDGWPKYTDEIIIPGGFPAEGVSGSPALIDLDSDGFLEVIVGAWDGKVYIWRHDGTNFIEGVWPKQTGNPMLRASPAVGDLDGDGIYEIIIPSSDNNLYAWHQDGTSLIPQANGILYSFGDLEIPAYNSPALADIDNDGDMEVIMTVNQNALSSKIYAIDYTGGLVLDNAV